MKAFFTSVIAGLLCLGSATGAQLPTVTEVEYQPFIAATERLLEALVFVGAPLTEADEKRVRSATRSDDQQEAIRQIQRVLDRYTIAGVNINPESRVKVAEGATVKHLVQQGWRTFLVKVHNEAGINPELVAESPNARPQYKRSSGSPDPKSEISQSDVAQRFLDIEMFNNPPLKPNLSGLELEYRIIQLFSRDIGKREAKLAFNVGQGTQDIGFRNVVPILFNCLPAVEVVLKVADFDGAPTSAAFVVRDKFGRIYPNPARRLAPDFFFHNQVYRADGESLHLPPGDFSFEISRGPEYHVQKHTVTVKEGVVSQVAAFKLDRWIHPKTRQWISGDHHVHAAGCAHYENPTEGVTPADMMRHILGEDLNVGCVLTWGPCWYSQKNFFEGKTSALSIPNYLMRYDVEVSGFPSSHAGHLCLLRLSEDDYPGTKLITEWPSWTLPVLAWGKSQGGVVGYSHSGWGLALPDYAPNGERVWRNARRGADQGDWTGRAADILPDYEMPPFDGIGANEFVVTVAHDVCDFISAVDTPAIWELNIWYHTLNCGFRTKISGETDFPCIYGDKVGLGRIYVKLDQGQTLDFDTWVQGLKQGRSYCGDGMSHIFDFKVNNTAMGEPGTTGEISQLNLLKPGNVKVSFEVAALLATEPNAATEAVRNRRLDQKPYWSIERSRIDDSRTVPIEIIVNGYPVARKEIVADGATIPMEFDIEIEHSSWVAVRILPSVHTNPIFVEVGGNPIRASRRSAEWCIKAVDTCWNSKQGRIRDSEKAAAAEAYDQARNIYAQILNESVAE
jgi:hypothetical protein